ncbi:MAG: hypothetical protein ACJ8BE_08835 [Microvirga sp.]
MHGLERIDTTALAALLREAAADITAADERATIAESRCDDLEEELEELRRLLAVTESRAKAAEQRAHLAEAGIDPVRKQLMLAQAKAEKAERRALEAEKSAEESIARARAAEAKAAADEVSLRGLEDRLERVRSALQPTPEEPNLDDLVGYVADAMHDPELSELRRAA